MIFQRSTLKKSIRRIKFKDSILKTQQPHIFIMFLYALPCSLLQLFRVEGEHFPQKEFRPSDETPNGEHFPQKEFYDLKIRLVTAKLGIGHENPSTLQEKLSAIDTPAFRAWRVLQAEKKKWADKNNFWYPTGVDELRYTGKIGEGEFSVISRSSTFSSEFKKPTIRLGCFDARGHESFYILAGENVPEDGIEVTLEDAPDVKKILETLSPKQTQILWAGKFRPCTIP